MATTTVRYQKPSQADWAEIATNPELVGCLTEMGERGKAYAEALAAEFVETGHYASSFRLEHEVQTYRGTTRAAVLLVNDADYAAALEDGWGGTDRPPAYHVLARVKHLLENAQ